MQLNEYQTEAHKTAIYRQSIREYVEALGIPDPVKENQLIELLGIVYPILGMVGEAGEVAGKLKKIIRDDKGILSQTKIQDMQKETGNVLWYVADTSTALGKNLETLAVENLNKLAKRKTEGTIGGSGDNR